MEKECSPVAVRDWKKYPALLVIFLSASTAIAQTQGDASSPAAGTVVSSGSTAQSQGTNPYSGSVVQGQATTGVLSLSLDEAIQRGLRQNLGIILSGTSVQTAGGQKLQDLQRLLPTVGGYLREAVMQTDLEAQGIRAPGVPAVIGPYGYTDLRGTLSWSLINVAALQNYLASKHNFEGTKLSAEDARDMVTLTVGNAYLLVISDAARIRSVQAQVDTAKVSLDQAVANHEAGISPLLDELRARVDYQTLQQSLITSTNQFEKDKIALARAIGLPLDQKFELTDQAPYAALDTLDVDVAVKQALANRKDLQALEQQVTGRRSSVPQPRQSAIPPSVSKAIMGISVLTSGLRMAPAMR